MDEFERCMLVKNEVHVYKIPPRSTARGYRAANWSLATPDWTGRLRAMARGKSFELRLEDKNSGELFAACPVEQYPGTSVEAVLDSSRYFVLCIQDKDRRAYIGIGFADRADSFDLNVVLHDHFKWIKRQEEEKAAVASGDSEDGTSSKPSLDLSLKEGQTFHINIPKKDGVRSVSKNNKPGGGFILPPPSSSSGAPRIAPPPGETPVTSPTDPSVISRNLLDAEEDEDWGEFKGGSSSVQPSGNWVTF